MDFPVNAEWLNIGAEMAAVEEGHRCRRTAEPLVFAVASDTSGREGYTLHASGVDGYLVVVCGCDRGRQGRPGVLGCKHAALVARRFRREGLARFDGVVWELTPAGRVVVELQPTRVRRYVDTHARHGFVYLLGGRWHVEHCTAGEWHTCQLRVPADAADRDVNLDAMRDLSRRPHVGPLPERLRGRCHA